MSTNTAKGVRVTPANISKEQNNVIRNYNYGYNQPINTPPIGIIPVPNNAFNNSGNIEKILTQFANQFQPQAQATTTGAGAGLSNFAANNKWLLIGGAGLLAYFLFFSNGLGASEKTVTSVTRFGRKS